MKLAQLTEHLRGTNLGDVVVPGFLTPDTGRFHLHPRWVYFECGERWLEMATIEDTGRMALAMVEAPVQPALELDDDWRSGWCSLFDQVMVMPYAEPGLVALHLWDVHEGPDRLECAAARMVLAGGQRLFVDPSWIFGIHLGGREQERSWAENLGGALPGEVVVALGAGARGAGGSGE